MLYMKVKKVNPKSSHHIKILMHFNCINFIYISNKNPILDLGLNSWESLIKE